MSDGSNTGALEVVDMAYETFRKVQLEQIKERSTLAALAIACRILGDTDRATKVSEICREAGEKWFNAELPNFREVSILLSRALAKRDYGQELAQFSSLELEYEKGEGHKSATAPYVDLLADALQPSAMEPQAVASTNPPNLDATILENKKCVSCGLDISARSEYCRFCGARQK